MGTSANFGFHPETCRPKGSATNASSGACSPVRAFADGHDFHAQCGALHERVNTNDGPSRRKSSPSADAASCLPRLLVTLEHRCHGVRDAFRFVKRR
jgi:hypothetical protein